MLSPRLRQQVFSLWTMFWSSGMNNPLTAIEQITYLLFLKRLEILDRQRLEQDKLSIYGRRPNCRLPHYENDKINIDERLPEGADLRDYEKCLGHGTCRWSYIISTKRVDEEDSGEVITPHTHISQNVFPWLRVLDETLRVRGNGASGKEPAMSAPMQDAYFQFPAEKGSTLVRALRQIEQLFKHIGSQNEDIMGDIFEYLLSEIEASGKNGQFRTPRHVIRLMIALLDPKYHERICDPAAGSGGFLINSIQYVRAQYSGDTVIYEWDGTPHHVYGDPPEPYPGQSYPAPESCTGYDNDPTMMRIGWMNMILHGIDDPHMIWRDALSKRMEDVEKYDVVLANPPFAGSVDVDDLHPDLPRHPTSRQKPITDKSDLLFIWQILRLLKNGGRAAVIVPEGVLFGSTNAHKELRRQLLLEHLVEAVISLPPGLFLPYTGVKTSILIFHRRKEPYQAGQEPVTRSVWFYEVGADGYSLDAKRRERPEANDFWDTQEKWHTKPGESSDYYRPTIETVRWRLVDEEMIKIFPEYRTQLERELDKAWGLHELFPAEFATLNPRQLEIELEETGELRKLFPEEFAVLSLHHPDALKASVQTREYARIWKLYQQAIEICAIALAERERNPSEKTITDSFDKAVKDLNRVFDAARRREVEEGVSALERGSGLPEFGYRALDEVLRDVRTRAEELAQERAQGMISANRNDFGPLFASGDEGTKDNMATAQVVSGLDVPDWASEAAASVHEFAKLDGYDVRLLGNDEGIRQTGTESKCWRVNVRTFLPDPAWRSSDDELEGSHDEDGEVRPEYLADLGLYNKDGTVRKELLDPDCLEYNDFILMAGRYKPFKLAGNKYEPPEEIIRALQALEARIQDGLANLLVMVEEGE